LRLGSPCIGAGIPVEQNGGRDLSGAEVPASQPPTLGAMEANPVVQGLRGLQDDSVTALHAAIKD